MQIKLTITKNAVLGLAHLGICVGAIAGAVDHYIQVNGFNIHDPSFVYGMLIAGATALKSYAHLSEVPVTITPAPSTLPAPPPPPTTPSPNSGG
jgi:hypothetical protein